MCAQWTTSIIIIIMCVITTCVNLFPTWSILICIKVTNRLWPNETLCIIIIIIIITSINDLTHFCFLCSIGCLWRAFKRFAMDLWTVNDSVNVCFDRKHNIMDNNVLYVMTTSTLCVRLEHSTANFTRIMKYVGAKRHTRVRYYLLMSLLCTSADLI